MALAILDGTQTATTLSTILSSGQHITAHTVVSLGAQAITDILNATSAGITNTQLRASAVTIGGTVTANPTGTQTIAGSVTASISNSVTIASLPAISGTITASLTASAFTTQGGIASTNNGSAPSYGVLIGFEDDEGGFRTVNGVRPLPVEGDVSILGFDAVTGYPIPIQVTSSGSVFASLSSALPAGTNRIGVVTIGAGTVTIGAGTAQIGSVTASISGTVPISISSVTVGNSVTIGSLPKVKIQGFNGMGGGQYLDIGVTESGAIPVVLDVSLPAGTEQIGTVTANTFAVQGTSVTTSNFTSTTASTLLAGFNATREVLTIFNEGAGNLHICGGATCTTIQYQVRLSSGDYYEVPNHQTSITHSAVFATAGTARVTQVS